MRLIYFLLLILTASLQASERGSSEPYISGDSFRAHCDFIFDETIQNMEPSLVLDGNTVFVKTDYLAEFFERIHPKIQARYILVTHNSDAPIPGNFRHMLEDPKLIAWFGQNLENFAHPKIHPIPIGLANQCWAHGNIKVVTEMIAEIGKMPRDVLLYMNFTQGTYPTERSRVADLFKDKFFCVISHAKPYREYLADLARAKFVLSPRGNGLDCHRTWECLLMGAIPIVRTSSLDSMYENLPVLIVKKWKEVNRPFLNAKYREIKAKSCLMEKAYFKYWWTQIEKAK